MTYQHRQQCRLCDSDNLEVVLSLTPTPPANAFIKREFLDVQQACFPLDLYFCHGCAHLQLLDVVAPDVLFENYVYVSGTSPVFVEHFRQYADQITQFCSLKHDDLVVDIGSNDGTFLRFFLEQGNRVLGVDPAKEISEQANQSGINTINGFFGESMARQILDDYGQAKVVSANNVFAHIDDIKSVVRGVRQLLQDDGVFVFEVSYLLDLYQKKLFDMVYHEHLDYHSIIPLQLFFQTMQMEIISIEKVNTHGGSIRCYVSHANGPIPVDNSVSEFVSIEKENLLDKAETFFDFATKIKKNGIQLLDLIKSLKSEGKRIAAFGAPAKATTLMYHYGLNSEYIDYIVDDSPLKQGLYSPGLHLPVVSSDALKQDTPDYLLILAWNFAEPIINKNREYQSNGGKFIVPLPELEII